MKAAFGSSDVRSAAPEKELPMETVSGAAGRPRSRKALVGLAAALRGAGGILQPQVANAAHGGGGGGGFHGGGGGFHGGGFDGFHGGGFHGGGFGGFHGGGFHGGGFHAGGFHHGFRRFPGGFRGGCCGVFPPVLWGYRLPHYAHRPHPR